MLERAIERFGLEELPLDVRVKGANTLQDHLSAPAQRIALPEDPELFELPVPGWIPQRGDKPPKPTVLPGLRLPADVLTICPATPVYYMHRRFGGEWSDLECHQLADRPVLRFIMDAQPVGLVALTIPGQEARMDCADITKAA